MFSHKTPLEFYPTHPISHRAHSSILVPENTLSAVIIAKQRGATWIECDVKLTKNGVLIVMHDDTLKRTTNAEGEAAELVIEKLTYNKIKKWDAGCKFSPKFAGEKIPTLVDFLHLIRKLNLGLVLEIKGAAGLDVKTAAETVAVLQRCHFLDYPRLLVQSFVVDSLREVKRLCPSLNLGLLIEEWGVYTRSKTGIAICDEPVDVILQELGCTALVAKGDVLTPERIAHIKTIVPYVLSWTINDPKKAYELMNAGVNAVISDDPERVARRQTRSSKRNFMFKPLEESVREESSCGNAQLNTELQQGLTSRRVRSKF